MRNNVRFKLPFKPLLELRISGFFR